MVRMPVGVIVKEKYSAIISRRWIKMSTVVCDQHQFSTVGCRTSISFFCAC